MILLVNALASLLSLYLYWSEQVPEVWLALPVLLLSMVALVVPTTRLLPLILVMANVCVLCMGAVVLVVLLVDGVSADYPLSSTALLGYLVLLLLCAAVNVIGLRDKAGVMRQQA